MTRKKKPNTYKKWLIELFERRVFVSILILLQFGFLLYVTLSAGRLSQYITIGLAALSFLTAIYAVSRGLSASYKLSWVFLLLSFPIFGGLLYLLFNFQSSVRVFQKRSADAQKKNETMFSLPKDSLESAKEAFPQYTRQMTYLQQYAGFPVYDKTETRYLSPGEDFFPVLLEELEKAQKYIFLEFFIVSEGKMFDSVLEILKRKAEQGVKVRILYDDIGCFWLLPKDYTATLKKYGIEAAVFNPFRPMLSAAQNNRDHRKIAAIDGRVAFTGGINLADEYINGYVKHGYWKDSAIMLSGKAAWSMTLIFLQNWELVTGANDDVQSLFEDFEDNSDGFVQPYADSPLDSEAVGREVYMQMITDAKRYLYIMTPYFIVDDSMMSALILSAKSGVDVRIITPKIWDKKLVHTVTRSYYEELIKGGVKVYEFTPGFIHSKTMICDDEVAAVGTVNLDFRSLYLHFECGAKVYGSQSVKQLKEDFLETQARSEQIFEENIKKGFFARLFNSVLRLFAPLL